MSVVFCCWQCLLVINVRGHAAHCRMDNATTIRSIENQDRSTQQVMQVVMRTLYMYIQGGVAGGRVRAAFEANARRQRKITAKSRLRCQGPLTNIR